MKKHEFLYEKLDEVLNALMGVDDDLRSQGTDNDLLDELDRIIVSLSLIINNK